MKKTDIAMVVLIAGVSMMAAFLIASNLSFLKVSKQGTKVDTVEKISSSVEEPDTATFNSEAINPTVKTVIGRSSN